MKYEEFLECTDICSVCKCTPPYIYTKGDLFYVTCFQQACNNKIGPEKELWKALLKWNLRQRGR